MKREIFLSLFLGFIAREAGNFWLAEEDTFENHYANIKQGIRKHEFVFKKVTEDNTDHTIERLRKIKEE